jgi:hypothetical protein
MADIVKKENDLVAIRVRLSRSGKPAIVFDVERAGQSRHRVEIDPRDLGVSADLDASRYRYGEPDWRIPAPLLDELRREVDRALHGEPFRALWFHIASPSGFLTLLPWERLLAPFGVPVLRVPHFALFPQLQTAELDIAVCVSQPRAKRSFDAASSAMSVAAALLEASGRAATVHIFADADSYASLRSQNVVGAGNGRIRLYDPADGPPDGPSEGGSRIVDSSTMAWSPWLHWMAHVLPDRTLEIVHFVAHSYLSQDQAALAVSESPVVNEDRRWSRFVGPQQLATFLDHVGAWAVGITSPEHNFSPMGARLLIDELAHRRAGPVLLHDLERDLQAVQLRDVYRALLDSAWPEHHSEIALYCHPRLFLQTSTGDSLPYAEVLLAEPRGSASVDQPPWVTVTRRYLEQSTARLFPDTEQPTSPVQLAAAEGVRQALSFVNDVMSSYSGTSGQAQAEPTTHGEAGASADADDGRPQSRA